MRLGRLGLSILSMLALTLACSGCGYLDPFRQGFITTYKPELRQLAEDIDRAELAKISRPQQTLGGTENCAEPEAPPQVDAWQPASLLPAVRLQPPVAIDAIPNGLE